MIYNEIILCVRLNKLSFMRIYIDITILIWSLSLNNSKIFYPNFKNTANTPCFSINYDPNRESYYGKEKKVNINPQVKDFILSGKEEFNILEFEVYEIEI